ncbi:hypothetical protein V9L05_19350 [Bernardetia sp. Wsw4-3y2]|uniref:hypothetical protein n=1 Tax=Bernardetia sp. Wsw4-3y2 TaxID=3127471 RepID=UPI0030CB2945
MSNYKMYIFTYKGNNKSKELLLNEIKQYVASWYRFDNSSYILGTNKEIEGLRNIIRAYMDDRDTFMLLEITIERYSFKLPTRVMEWFRNQIQRHRNK